MTNLKNRIITSLVFFILGSLVQPFVFAVDPMSITVVDFTGNSGDTVEAVIMVDPAENIGSLDLSLGYDPQILFFVDVLHGFLTEESIVEYNHDDGLIHLIIIDADGFSGSGPLLKVHFKVIGTPGDSSDLVLTDVEANDATTYVDKIIELSNGVFTIENKVPKSISCTLSSNVISLGDSVHISGQASHLTEGDKVTIVLTDPNRSQLEILASVGQDGAFSKDFTPGIEGIWNLVVLNETENVSSSELEFTVEGEQSGGIPGYGLVSVIIGLASGTCLGVYSRRVRSFTRYNTCVRARG